jgi:hypothetical protein
VTHTLYVMLLLAVLFWWITGSLIAIVLAIVGMIVLSGGEPGGYLLVIIPLALLPRLFPRPVRVIATALTWTTLFTAICYGGYLWLSKWWGDDGLAFCAMGFLWSFLVSVKFHIPEEPNTKTAKVQRSSAEVMPRVRIEPYLGRGVPRPTIEGTTA